MSPLTLQSALLIMMFGGKQKGTPQPTLFIDPYQFVDLQRAFYRGEQRVLLASQPPN